MARHPAWAGERDSATLHVPYTHHARAVLLVPVLVWSHLHGMGRAGSGGDDVGSLPPRMARAGSGGDDVGRLEPRGDEGGRSHEVHRALCNPHRLSRGSGSTDLDLHLPRVPREAREPREDGGVTSRSSSGGRPRCCPLGKMVA